jgi:hypothetical protein
MAIDSKEFPKAYTRDEDGVIIEEEQKTTSCLTI